MSERLHWSSDRLNRSVLSDRLVELVEAMPAGGVFGIDAPFGHGKSFFAHGFAADLRDNGFVVAQFDAWKADLAPNPLFLFVAEVMVQLEQQGLSAKQRVAIGKRVNALVGAVARIGVKSLLRAGDEELDKLAEPFIAEVDRLDFTKKGAAAQAVEFADQVGRARSAFAETVTSLLVEPEKKLPLVVIIDELDRARPDFAIEFLEAIKFIFATEHVAFVLCVDRKNLCESIKARFGPGYDVSQYLARIFSFWVVLENPLLNKDFLLSTLSSSLVTDGTLSNDDNLRKGVIALKDFAVIGLAERSGNLRSIQRCAERASICARLCRKNQWAAVIGFVSGLSVSDAEFLRVYCSAGQRTQASSAFLSRIMTYFGYARTDWERAALVSWALPPEDVIAGGGIFVTTITEGIRIQAAQISRGLQNQNVMGKSPANLVWQNVGWVLG